MASDYADVDGSNMHFKFVVFDRTDIQEAGRAVAEYKPNGIECPGSFHIGLVEVKNTIPQRSGLDVQGKRMETFPRLQCYPYLETHGELNR